MGISIGDSLAAIFATVGALSALHHRQKTGQGQVVDSAIYEAVLAMMESLVSEYDQTGYIRERTGSILPNVAPSNIYPTSDDQMILIAANQDTIFGRLAKATGQAELSKDERFATHAARGVHQKEIDQRVAQWTCTKSAQELLDLMEEAGVPAGMIYRAPDMLKDPHFAAREAIVRLAHPEFGEIAMQNVFPKLSLTPGTVRWPGPELGEHNEEIFSKKLGMNDKQLNMLNEAGVI